MNPPFPGNKEKFLKSPRIVFRAKELDLSNLPRVDAHLHTSWTDGKGSVEEVYAAAVDSRLEAINYSEHSRKTSVDWFPLFAAQVRGMAPGPCRAYVGTECKVEAIDGTVDTAPGITNFCDFVTVSVHRFPDSNGIAKPFADVAPDTAVDLEYQLTWAVLENPIVDILGHMFGMSLRRFKVTPPEGRVRMLIARAAQFGVAVEINTRYHSEPLKLLQWCRECDALVTFGSDAHTVASVGEDVRMLMNEKQPK